MKRIAPMITGVVLAGLCTLALPSVAEDRDPHVPKVVKLAELIKQIQEHKGKVVVMDVWNDG